MKIFRPVDLEVLGKPVGVGKHGEQIDALTIPFDGDRTFDQIYAL